MKTNEERAKELIDRFGFDLDSIPKDEIISLTEKEIKCYHDGSSEYIRLLCGYLYCIGDSSDIPLINKAKHINFDVGCMIDGEWIQSLENGGKENKEKYIRPKEEIVREFVDYYSNFNIDI